jgi:beta-lactamase superfamily II metal-dependent hydrolase
LEILQRYKADYFLWTGIEKQDAENKRLIELLKNSKKVLNVFSGEKIKAGGAEIDILYPFESLAGEKTESSVNNTSIVAKLIYGKDLFLFTGDISSKAETQLTNSAELVKADVLKVAHHGSKYSSSEEFLENVRPEYAVISVGKNTYGHPAPEVLQRLKKYDIKILRTDQNGDIKFISNGNGISNFFH